jgi:aldehyde dehydrogenase (NAD(P)+)
MTNNIVGSQSDNCGFNCNSPKLLITCKNWPQREEFIKCLKESYKTLKTTYAYYPGATERWQKFRDTYKQGVLFGEGDVANKQLPWLFIPDVPPKKGELALEMEPWAPVLSETAIDCDPKDFLSMVVKFCNEIVWGNLSASIYIHPTTEAAQKDAFEKALSDLQYGGIAVNQWSATVYSTPLPWGAFPINSARDIRSGIGFVHNCFLADNIEKAVIRFPFYMPLGTRMYYFMGCKNGENLASALADFALYPTFWNLGKVVYQISWN